MMLILSGLWIYEVSRPVYEDKEIMVPSYTLHGSYIYSVPVTRENFLYPVGTILKMGMPAYFFAVSPNIDMSFTYRFESADSADISGKLGTMIVATGKEGDGTAANAEKIFWQKEFPLKAEEDAETWDGPSVTKNFSLNVSEIQSKVKKLQEQVNYPQDATIEIVNRVTYNGKINGKNVQGTKDFAIPLVISSSYYQLPEELDFSQDTNITKKVSVKSNSPLPTFKMPLFLFLLSLVLIGTTIICTRIGKVKPEYIEKLKKEEKHLSFKEFISRGKLHEDRNSLMKVEISSLKELVDAATDMNLRVVYDEEAETYFMINSNVMYIFVNTFEEGNKNRSN